MRSLGRSPSLNLPLSWLSRRGDIYSPCRKPRAIAARSLGWDSKIDNVLLVQSRNMLVLKGGFLLIFFYSFFGRVVDVLDCD